MTVSAPNARREMFAHINACWQADTLAIVGYVPEIRWQGLEKKTVPGADKFWMRASTQEVDTNHSGFAVPQFGVSDVVYDTDGVVTLQIFAPMKERTAYDLGEKLAQVGRRAFMATSTPSAVWFRRPRVRELDNDGTWYRWNVIADYHFSQVKGDT